MNREFKEPAAFRDGLIDKIILTQIPDRGFRVIVIDKIISICGGRS